MGIVRYWVNDCAAVCIMAVNVVDGSIRIVVGLSRRGINMSAVQAEPFLIRDRINPFSWLTVDNIDMSDGPQPFCPGQIADLRARLAQRICRMKA
jgi:hypothetical protein